MDGCIRWGGDRQRGRDSFGVNLGHLVVINGTLLHSCAKVCELIKLSFGMGLVEGWVY